MKVQGLLAALSAYYAILAVLIAFGLYLVR